MMLAAVTPIAPPPPGPLDFGALVEEFLERLDRTPETHRACRSGLATFEVWAAQQEPTEDLEGLMLAFKAHRSELVAPATVVHNLAVLRRFFGWLVKTGRLAANPVADIRPPKLPRGHRRDALTLTETIRLLDQVDTSTDRGKREMAVLCLMVRAGLRDVELHRANIDHLATVDGHRVLWVHGKGRDQADEFVLLNRKAWAALEAYLTTRGQIEPGAPLLVGFDCRCHGRLTTRSIRRIVTAALERVGLKSGGSRPTACATPRPPWRFRPAWGYPRCRR